MTTPKISEDEYIVQLNERLRAHADYRPGMEFYAHPEGATGGNIRGLAIRGLYWNKAYMDVNNSMQNDFDIEPTYSGFQRQVK